jgi:hypothetical protein
MYNDNMRIAFIISLLLTLLLSIFLGKMFFKRFKVGFYYIDKYEEAVQDALIEIVKSDPNYMPPVDYDNAMDLRGTPTHTCPCGSEVWLLKVTFADYEISNYFLDMECFKCGSLATAPTPIDRDNREQI